ncbi:interferon a3-like [Menidia menidia]
MLGRIFFACLVLLLGLCSPGSSLSCRWMDHKFRQYSENSLVLIDMMASDYTGQHEVAFPHHLYSQASKLSPADKVAFAAQVLKEVCELLEEEDGSSSWEESTVEHFLNVIIRQGEELSACIGGHKKTNRKLHMYFKRLPRTVFVQMGRSAEAWELIRREIKSHLMEMDLLVASLLTAN